MVGETSRDETIFLLFRGVPETGRVLGISGISG